MIHVWYLKSFNNLTFISQIVCHGLLEKMKFSVLELQEYLDTYNNRKEAAFSVRKSNIILLSQMYLSCSGNDVSYFHSG